MDMLPIGRALLSVTDKSGLAEFAAFLAGNGVELVSTGGTKKAMEAAGLAVTSVSDVTGFPEILGGRVKTLHPYIHGGVLADKDDPAHLTTLADHGIKTFDLVCVNLYDFASAVRGQADLKAAVEQIDIGGPTLLRAAAKNFHSMLVVPDPLHYPRIMAELAANGFKVGLGLRRELAAETFRRVSGYDAMIAEYISSREA
ncbi:IMP cyclohydrolase [Desulfocurvibacter africanus]|uniref:IMP cyclohydrolase n=1 Tax=Desulfocurvibacter africanus TaxID=873 RepID=UPI0003FCA79D|nr:IMP cyclohydrolase [Desulfocurvibacter africanus]